MNSSRELGDFLRARREQLAPNDLGLTSSSRRRTPGLRREEVAQRAGISSEWYVKLEQGRAVAPSAATITALGRALCLDAAEARHLHALAERSGRRNFVREAVPEPLAKVVLSMADPAYLTGQRWDVLTWNPGADAIFRFSEMPEADCNILLYMFADKAAEQLFGASWADEAQRMLALFRANHDLWAGDPAFQDLLLRLRTTRPEFSSWWSAHRVGIPTAGRKTLTQTSTGAVVYDYATFQANDDPALKLAIYIRR